MLGVIGLIDYGSGNLRSVEKALIHVGAEVRKVTSPEELDGCASVALPGVGAFDDCVNALRRQRLLKSIYSWIHEDRPFLGICVGYQVLFEGSEEFLSTERGLGVFKGKVIRFPDKPSLKIPQIGWNRLMIKRSDCPIYKGIPDGVYVYFVHSFFPAPENPEIVATETEYEVKFASSVWRGNTFATQFHPEKSQKVGLRILKNFVDLSNIYTS